MIQMDVIVRLLEEKKAENIVVLNLHQAFVEHMVIASASSHRQLVTLAETVVEYAKKEGIKPLMDGSHQSDWVVVDVGCALVHLFKPESRTYYNLEKMWGQDKPQLEVVSVDDASV